MSRLRHIPYAVLTAGSLLVGGGAYAQSISSIEARDEYQQQRIQNGIRDGQLTRGEAARLEQGERRIDRYEDRALARGPLTPAERQHIDAMQNRESRQIYRDTHNDRTAWNPSGRDHDGWRDHGREGWRDRREDRREAGDRREDRREGWRDRREDRHEGFRDAREDRREGRRDQREDRREADRHDPGHNGQNGWNHGDHNNTASNGSPHQWNGGQSGNTQHAWNGGWTGAHNGNGAPSSHSGQTGTTGTGTTGTGTTGTGTTNGSSQHSWGGYHAQSTTGVSYGSRSASTNAGARTYASAGGRSGHR